VAAWNTQARVDSTGTGIGIGSFFAVVAALIARSPHLLLHPAKALLEGMSEAAKTIREWNEGRKLRP
jgi:hypothetical protein